MIDARATMALVMAVAISGCDQGTRDPAPVAVNEPLATRPADPPATGGSTATSVPVTPEPGAKSVFTSLDVTNCKLIERNVEEAGYSRHRCDGAAGYALELIESDLRQTMEVIRPGGKRESLDLSSLVAGGGFSSVGKTAEWRGSDPAMPRTLTIRYGVNENPDPKVAPRSYLVVAKLASPACVVARVAPGPDQSGQARAISDADALPRCLGN